MPPDEPRAASPRTAILEAALESLPAEDDGAEIEVIDGWIDLADMTLVGRTIVATEAEEVELTRGALTSCRLITAPDTEVRVRQCVFTNCDISQVQFKSIQASRLVSCKMTGTQLVGEMSDCEVVESQLQMASLVMSKINRVGFAGCEFVDVDMQESKLADVTFDGSRLTEVSLHRTIFERVDLRAAAIGSLTSVQTLHGCIVANNQLYELAPLLANIVGLTIASEAED